MWLYFHIDLLFICIIWLCYLFVYVWYNSVCRVVWCWSLPYMYNLFEHVMLLADYYLLYKLNYDIQVCDTNSWISTSHAALFRGYVVAFFIFSVRLLSVLCGHSVFPSPPQRPMNSDFKGFSIPDFIHYIFIYFSYLNSWERASISLFNFQC